MRSPRHWAIHCARTGRVRCWVEGTAERAREQCREGERAAPVPPGARGSHIELRSGAVLQRQEREAPTIEASNSVMVVQLQVSAAIKIKRKRLREKMTEPGFISRVMEHLISNGILDDMEL